MAPIKIKLSLGDFDLLVRGDVLKQVVNVGFGNQEVEVLLADIGFDYLRASLDAAESDSDKSAGMIMNAEKKSEV